MEDRCSAGASPKSPAATTAVSGDEREHGAVDPDVGRARNRGRGQQRRGAGAPRRQGQPGDAAQCAQDQALGQELADQPSPAGSERRPDGELALPRGAGGQQQVGQVGAGDEQHDADGRSEHQQAAPRSSHHRLEQRRHPHRLAVVAGRELLLQAGGDGGEVGARLVERRRRRQPAHAADEVPAAIGGGRVEPERQEDVGGAVRVLLDVAIARRQHADHGVGLRVHPHRPADDAGRAGEAPPPEPITDERDRRRVGPILLRQERPAQRRLHPERREIGLRDPHHPDAFGVAVGAADGGRADEPVRAHRGERAGVAGVVEEIGRRQIADLAVVVVEAAHLDQSFGRRVGEWREQHRADDAEHRRVGADAEGERADGDRGEAGAGAEAADGEPQVLPHGAIDGQVAARVVSGALGSRAVAIARPRSGRDGNGHAPSLAVHADVSHVRDVGDERRQARGGERHQSRQILAGDEDRRIVEALDAIVAARAGRELVQAPATGPTVDVLAHDRGDQQVVGACVPEDAVGPFEPRVGHRDRHLALGRDAIDAVGLGPRGVARWREDEARVRDVERAVGRGGDVVEEERAVRGEVDDGAGLAGGAIEAAQHGDVGHDQVASDDGHALGPVQGDAVLAAGDELALDQRAVGAEEGNEAVVVGRGGVGVDVAHEVLIALRVVAGGFGDGEALDDSQTRRYGGLGG